MEGNGRAPDEMLISRVCEEFSCLPDKAIQAIENDVGGLLIKILDLRAYIQAKQNYDQAKPEQKATFRKGSLEDLVGEFTFEMAKEQLNRAKD